MRTSVLIGLAAGTALSMSAFGQSVKEITPIRRDRATRAVKVAPADTFSSDSVAYRATNTRSVGPALVYDNLGWDGTSYFGTLDYWFWFGFLNAPHYADDFSLVPGNLSQLYAPGGQLLTGMDIFFDVQDGFATGARPVQVAIEFWDTADGTTAAPLPAFNTSLGGFSFNISLDNLYTYLIPLDLTTLPAGGMQLNDNGFHIDVAFYEQTPAFPPKTYLPAGDSAAMDFNCTSTWATAGQSPTISNGGGRNWFFFDPGLDGTCSNTERYVAGGVGGYFLQCNFAMNLYGDARCAADFDNNGFVEPIDYNNFINAYELGPCP